MLRVIIFLLLFSTRLSAAPYNDIYTFFLQWKGQLEEKEVNCHYVDICYADSVNFYSERVPRSGMCYRVTMIPFLDENILTQPAEIIPVNADSSEWKITFDNAQNMFGLNKEHYMIIREKATGEFEIATQSSVADDRWAERKKEIASRTIIHNQKLYYILGDDSTTLNGYHLYVLTDTLAFTVPECYCACADDTTLGYYTSGNVYAAMSGKNRKTIKTIQQLQPEVYKPVLDHPEKETIRCFELVDTTDSQGKKIWQWQETKFEWMKTGKDVARLQFQAPVENGDQCLERLTNIHVLSKKKKIVVSWGYGYKVSEKNQQ